MVTNVVEVQRWNLCRCLTRQYVSNGTHGEVALPPAVHTWFWTDAIIVWQDVEDFHLAKQSLLCCSCFTLSCLYLGTCWEQYIPVFECPAVELCIGEFESLSIKLLGQGNDILNRVDSSPVQKNVDPPSKPNFP